MFNSIYLLELQEIRSVGTVNRQWAGHLRYRGSMSFRRKIFI